MSFNNKIKSMDYCIELEDKILANLEEQGKSKSRGELRAEINETWKIKDTYYQALERYYANMHEARTVQKKK